MRKIMNFPELFLPEFSLWRLNDGRREELVELKSQDREVDGMSETMKWRTMNQCGEDKNANVVFLVQCPLIYDDLKQILGEE